MTKGYSLTPADQKHLRGVHPELAALIGAALSTSPIRFKVTEGLRSSERQAQLFKKRLSWTLNSRHLTGHAVDIACYDDDGVISWDLKWYRLVAPHIKATARQLGTAIKWGGDWTKVDAVHFELDAALYPLNFSKAA